MSDKQPSKETSVPIFTFPGSRADIPISSTEEASLKEMQAQIHKLISQDLKERIETLSPKGRDELTRFCNDTMLLRYLRGEKGKVSEAMKSFKKTLEWRMQYKPEEISWSELHDVTAQGHCYWSGFDKDGHPLIYIKSREEKVDPMRDLRLYLYFLELIPKCMPRGYEKIVIIIDFTKYSSKTAASLSVVRECIDILTSHYPETLRKAFLVNAPWIFKVFWKVLSPFLDPVTRDKISFANVDSNPEENSILAQINADMLETNFGGTIPFVYDDTTYISSLEAFLNEKS